METFDKGALDLVNFLGDEDSFFDLLLREESDISQTARNQLGWRVVYTTGRRSEGEAPRALALRCCDRDIRNC
jgi:hypothetical protein